MAIFNLTRNYNALSKQLADAIANDKKAAIRELDRKIEKEFEAILAANLIDISERRKLTAFLLERLTPRKQRSSLQSRICDKIIEQLVG